MKRGKTTEVSRPNFSPCETGTESWGHWTEIHTSKSHMLWCALFPDSLYVNDNAQELQCVVCDSKHNLGKSAHNETDSAKIRSTIKTKYIQILYTSTQNTEKYGSNMNCQLEQWKCTQDIYCNTQLSIVQWLWLVLHYMIKFILCKMYEQECYPSCCLQEQSTGVDNGGPQN